MTPEEGSHHFDQTDIVRLGGDDAILVGGGFPVAGDDLRPLLGTLPRFLRIPADVQEAAVLRDTLRLLGTELASPAMGGSLMTRRLADILLVQALRACAAGRDGDGLGWIGALADRRIGTSLSLMHRDAGHAWTVGELATAVGMSRSAFALRFKQLVGAPPLAYLLRWRMRRARAELLRNGASVASLAARLGYSSESAFGNAFKRVFGQAPKRYRSSGDRHADEVAV